MASKLETRITTMKYHGISSADWWKLTDEEQEALIREAWVSEPCEVYGTHAIGHYCPYHGTVEVKPARA